MRWPALQARVAATTEIGSGVLLALGMITPLAAAGMIGVMTVAIVTSHARVGFFVFKQGQGWEYCASIAVGAWVVAVVGPGRWSLDHALDIEATGWTGAVTAALVGLTGAVIQLGTSYRPPSTKA